MSIPIETQAEALAIWILQNNSPEALQQALDKMDEGIGRCDRDARKVAEAKAMYMIGRQMIKNRLEDIS